MAHKRRDDLPLSAEINVTSLVDVAFTLLVIFIITAPVLQGGIEVDIPEADVRPLTAEDEPFFVTIERDGSIYLAENEVTFEDFRASFPQMAEAGRFERVYLRGDSLAPWGRVVQVMGVLNQNVQGWSAVAQPWTGDGR